MNTRLLSRLAVFALILLVVVSIITASAAANTVPTSHLTDQTTAITGNNLKPAQCASYNLTAIVVCGPSIIYTGTSANELILGSSSSKWINGQSGTDCCIGRSGTIYTNCTWHP
jgi:hypothetical protein